jgi:Sulfotransferase family
VAAARQPAFLVVGTPRSGTTLVQRLASELPGVAVPPETHFFTEFSTALLRRHRFPLEGDALRAAVDDYAGRRYLRDVPFDPATVVADLDGRAGSPVDLYAAVVRHLAGDGAEVVGEKTPGHLLWWRPLSTAIPGLKLVVVVRDPRAVAVSHVRLGWSGDHVKPAQRWNDDRRRSSAAERALGPSRVLVVRFEDVVADPTAARSRLAGFLGIVPGPTGESAEAGLHVPAWETWKAGAAGPVDASAADRWRDELSPRGSAEVAAVCARGMAALGYDAAPAGRRPALAPAVAARRLRWVARGRWRDAEIARLSRGWA